MVITSRDNKTASSRAGLWRKDAGIPLTTLEPLTLLCGLANRGVTIAAGAGERCAKYLQEREGERVRIVGHKETKSSLEHNLFLKFPSKYEKLDYLHPTG